MRLEDIFNDPNLRRAFKQGFDEARANRQANFNAGTGIRNRVFVKSNIKAGLETHQKIRVFSFLYNLSNPIDVQIINPQS